MSKSPTGPFVRAGIIALTLGAATLVSAADGVQPSTGQVYKLNQTQVRAALAAHHSQATALKARALSKNTVAASGKVVAATSSLAGGFANPYRAYPASCLADGLTYATASADPNAQQLQLDTPIYDSATGAYDLDEVDTYTLWRVPCSGGVSAVVLEIDRPSANEGNTNEYPFFPNLYVGDSASPLYVRVPNDPNTVYSDTIVASPFVSSNIYVLEYYVDPSSSDASSTNGNFNDALTLNIDTLVTDKSNNEIIGTISIPAYSASNFNNYPSASNPLEISGYTSGPWYDPAHSGEGMLIEVYDNGDQATRTLSATWYTFDNLGLPFWLSAQASIPIQDTTAGVTNGYQVVNAPVKYVTGGGFAGNFTPPVTINNWGTMSLSFQDCGTLNFSYSGATGTNASDGPAGSGTRQWKRIGDINGVVCQ